MEGRLRSGKREREDFLRDNNSYFDTTWLCLQLKFNPHLSGGGSREVPNL